MNGAGQSPSERIPLAWLDSKIPWHVLKENSEEPGCSMGPKALTLGTDRARGQRPRREHDRSEWTPAPQG